MKNKIIIWTIVLITLVFLSYLLNNYSNKDSIEISSDMPNKIVEPPKNEGIDIKNEYVEMINYENIEYIKKEKEISILNYAWKYGKISICENIEDDNIKKTCLDNANANIASTDEDKDYCLKINNKSTKDNCLNEFSYNTAIQNNDLYECWKISNDENFIEKCKSTIIFTNIEKDITNYDNSICENFKNIDNKEYCFKILKK